jgi:protein tyrosine phosphatase (PTP) superfamily phosphohydrolase (DUF442 family)
MSRLLSLTFLSGALIVSSGCACCRQPVATRTTVVPGSSCPSAPCPTCPPGNTLVPPPPAPVGAVQPGVKIVTPPPGAGAPSIPSMPPGNASLSPRFEPNWQPTDGRNESAKIAQAGADPLLGSTNAGSSPPSGPRLYPPRVEDRTTGEPPLLESPAAPVKKPQSTLPAGIAQFAKAAPKVWNGQRPSIDDGLDWLAANEYRAVLHLRAPGEPDNADRKQVEKLGMAYYSIEVSPNSLTPEKLDEFAKAVRDANRQPLFVYDQDGSLAGPLWYLYYRKVDNDTDELARIKANALGLRADREGNHRLMWLATQKFLEENP